MSVPFSAPPTASLLSATLLVAVIYCALRVVLGLRTSLYLLNEDSVVRDQTLIPVTFSGRKRSWTKCLRNGRWKDDVELTLMDYQQRAYRVRITYGLWRGYCLEFQDGPEGLKLGRKYAVRGENYRLRSGMKLEAGGRRYEVRILPDRPELLHQY